MSFVCVTCSEKGSAAGEAAFKDRWVVLKGNFLFYFRKEVQHASVSLCTCLTPCIHLTPCGVQRHRQRHPLRLTHPTCPCRCVSQCTCLCAVCAMCRSSLDAFCWRNFVSESAMKSSLSLPFLLSSTHRLRLPFEPTATQNCDDGERWSPPAAMNTHALCT